MNDLDLLRRYEPILRFTKGEAFFPVRVDGYVRACDLWLREPNGAAKLLVPAGRLDLEMLAHYDEQRPGYQPYLRFVQEPLEGLEYQRWLLRKGRAAFATPGRLARVGLGARLIDAAFSLSLLLRGTVPGGTTAAAEQKYRAMLLPEPRYTYYGRVLRQSGYIILHYLFFYVMNDWRSSFYGANDHEADWEQLFIYLEDCDGEPGRPVWLAYAAHEESGDDLRRRWDDPSLAHVGDHPVVYVGAGSHACYFLPGEYLTRVEIGFLQPLFNAAHVLERIWRNTLQQGDPQKLAQRLEGALSIPFVDYARGDGPAIGPGGDHPWDPVLITPDMSWVEQYRGLWGLETGDPFSGEKAPAGPKYTRTGTIRETWYNPLGWSGLAKVAPPTTAPALLEQHIAALNDEVDAVRRQVDVLREALPRLDLEVRALAEVRHLAPLYEERRRELSEREAEMRSLQRRGVELVETIRAGSAYLDRIRAGETDDPRAHIHLLVQPQSQEDIRYGTLAETWSALSVGLLLLAFVGFVFFDIGNWLGALGILLGSYIVIEAIFRRRLEQLLLNLTIGLAVITSVVLVYEFFWDIILVGTVAVAGLIITDNIRELRRH